MSLLIESYHFQVMDLEQNELSWLANHLAHDVKTHTGFYRKHEASLELAKVSKLLLAAEYGKLSNYSGKNLTQINLDGNYFFIVGICTPYFFIFSTWLEFGFFFSV